MLMVNKFTQKLPQSYVGRQCLQKNHPAITYTSTEVSSHLMRRNAVNVNQPYLMTGLSAPKRFSDANYQQIRMFSWTKIPKLVLTASGVKKRGIVWGTLGAVTLLSSIVGPAVWITLGGVASLVTWRLAKKTANWWSYLDLPNSKTSFFQAVLLNIGTHRAAEIVRTNTVQHLKAYFEKTEQGKKVLEEFGLDHEKDLVWEDVLKYETVSVDKNTHKVNIEFWLEDEVSKGPAGGSCKVSSSALINGEGNVTLNEVRLSAPNWHEDEVVPV